MDDASKISQEYERDNTFKENAHTLKFDRHVSDTRYSVSDGYGGSETCLLKTSYLIVLVCIFFKCVPGKSIT